MNLLLTFVIALQVASGQVTLPPPPPHDPQPGPYVVFFDGSGRLLDDQDQTIVHAVNAWRGIKFEAFLLCFRQRSGAQTIGDAGFVALDTVARRLKTVGARIVIAPSLPLCSGSPIREQKDHDSVEVLGMVSL